MPSDHVRLAIVIGVSELKGCRGKVLPITKENRTNVNHGFSTVCPWTFNDLNMAV